MKRRALWWLVLLALAAAWFLQTSWAAGRDSVTIDEFAHLPTGLYYLRTGDYGLDPINPPWTRMFAALGVLRDAPIFEVPEAGANHWMMGYALVERNMADYQRLFVHARFMIAVLGAVCGALVVAWARMLYGTAPALVAGLLFAFSPSMLAHGHLVTLDMAGALGAVAVAMAAWWMLERPGWPRAALLGVLLAAATMLKLSAFALLASLLLIVVVAALADRQRSPLAYAGLLAGAGLVCVVCWNVFYGFAGTLAPMSSLRLDADGLLGSMAAAAPWLRLPLPSPLLEGVDMILNVGAEREPSYFLAGELSAQGWWYYHLAAFALKTPLPLLAASLMALALWLAGRSRGRREYCLWIPVLVLFAANAAANSLQIGVRHVLAACPLLIVLVSPVLADPLVALAGRLGVYGPGIGRDGVRGGVARGTAAASRPPAGAGARASARELAAAAVCALGLVWFVGTSLAAAPRYLAYFHELAGGPDDGHRWLIDSNLDWGQDLIRLREWMDANEVDLVDLAYFGRVDPRVYGIRYRPLDPARPSGVVAVSATFLMGRPYFWLYGGRMRWVPHNTYTGLQRFEPIGRAGTMFLYRFSP